MIIKLIEEVKFDAEPWYIIEVDGSYFKGSGDKNVAERIYQQILDDPKLLEPKKNILKSEEINVPLIEQNS